MKEMELYDPKQKTQDLTQKIGIKAEFFQHEKSGKTSQDVAEATGYPLENIIKTLIFLAPEDQKLIGVILPGQAKADTKKIQKIVGTPKIRMLKKAEIEDFLGFSAGGIPPVIVTDLDYGLMDKSLLNKDFIVGAAGDAFTGMKFSPKSFKKQCPTLKIFDLVKVPEQVPVPQKQFKFHREEIPTDAGCYLFFDYKDQLLYVGKANNLRSRVGSYFQNTKKSVKTEFMVSKIARIETRTVHSEMESLILENNLIKEFRPKFNILLRDDKSFVYLKITKEDFPRMEITRQIIRDGSFYLGPKTSAKSFRKTIAFCEKVFRVRTCRLKILGGRENLTPVQIAKNPENRKIPCLDYHINKCSGPCADKVSQEAYHFQVETMKKFLRGETKDVIQQLQERMMEHAKTKNFEAAAKMRDLIQSIETSTEKQTVQFSDRTSRDFIHFYRHESRAYFVRMAFRNGKFLDLNEMEFQVPEEAEASEILEKCIMQFYEKADEPPREILIPDSLNDPVQIQTYLSDLFEAAKIEIFVPQKGDKKRVLDLAAKNAKHYAEKKQLEKMSHAENFAKALPELAEYLHLDTSPKRIECYDISHFGGKATVGSQVVFINGEPAKAEYRKYHIKSLKPGKIDDFAAMNEVLGRRFQALSLSNKDSDTTNKKDSTPADSEKIPDLIVIDGGKGQLSSVMKIFDTYSVKNFDPKKQIISLAKREEEVFIPGQSLALEIPSDSAASKLLQRLRDEAHRFAISFNRATRQKADQKSVLDDIPGIGAVTKQKLLKTFGSVKKIKSASSEDLEKILNKTQVENLKKSFG